MRKRTALLVTIALLFNNGLPLLTFPLLTKTFDVSTYGVWVEANTIISLLVIFGSQGFINAVGLLLANQDTDREVIYSNALYSILAICGSLMLGLILLAPAVNAITSNSTFGSNLLRVLSLQIVLTSFSTLLFQIYRMQQRILLATLLDSILSIVRLAAVVAAVISHDLMFFAVTLVILSAMVTGLLALNMFRTIRLRPLDGHIVRSLLQAGWNLALVSQATWIVMFGDRLLLSILSTSTAVAVYAASYQLTLILNALSYPYLYALLPQLGERWRSEGLSGMQVTFRRATRAIIIVLVPATAGLILVGQPLLRVLATEAFVQSSLLIALIAVGVFIDSFNTAQQYVFYAQGQSQVLRSIYLKAALFNIAANLIAIPLFSYNGAGVTTLLTFLYIFQALWRKTGMALAELFDLLTLWRCLLAAAVMGVWVIAVVSPTVIGLGVAVGGGALIYGAGLLLLRVISTADVQAVVTRLRSRLRPAAE